MASSRARRARCATLTPLAPHRPARALIGVLALALALGAGPAAAQGAPGGAVRLPSLGETASQDLSVGSERRVGDQILREARRDPAFLDDPVLADYLQTLWQPLIAAARARGDIDGELGSQFAWELFAVRDKSVNAFALPGGYVGVHLGLVALTTTADQLASVLAHELTHVSQRHIARSVGNSQRASLMSMAAILLGILAASRSNNPDMANAAIAGGQAAGLQSQLNFSRDMEREADRVGFAVLAGAGFATAGMAQMFERLDTASRVNDFGGFPYLRTHPLTTERISEARNRVLLGGGGSATPTLMHALMQQRARVLMDTNPAALQRVAHGQSSSPLAAERVAALYGGALAQLTLRDAARAEAMAQDGQRQAEVMIPREPRAERAFALLRAEALLARGRAADALALLDALPEVPAVAPGLSGLPGLQGRGRSGADVGERPRLLLRARAALALGRESPSAAAAPLRRSTEALQTWVADHPQDASAWELLAGTAEAIGQKLRAMRAAAESRAMLGDLTGAIDRLRAAQASARGPQGGQEFIEVSVIDARLRQLERERRELVLEARGGRERGPDDERERPPQ